MAIADKLRRLRIFLVKKNALAAIAPRLEILRNMPFFIPFATRVQIFRQFIFWPACELVVEHGYCRQVEKAPDIPRQEDQVHHLHRVVAEEEKRHEFQDDDEDDEPDLLDEEYPEPSQLVGNSQHVN
jgi:hypothetical protein